MPLIHKKLIKLSREDVKDIFLKSKRGQQIMSSLIKTSANEWEQYRDEQREADVEEMGL
jgi:hypothetical protein